MDQPKKGGMWIGVVVILLLVMFLAGSIYLWSWFSKEPALPVVQQSGQSSNQNSPAGPATPLVGWAAKESGPVVATYTADFQSRTRPVEFSTGSVPLTKKGSFPYLGAFRAAGVVFSLDKTPPHRLIHVVFDLVLLNSWNGSSPIWGPDIWKAEVVHGPVLESATFGNCGFFDNNNEQTYPDRYPGPAHFKPYAAWTGALQHETLGEIRQFGASNPPSGDCSSVYHMDWTFPHTADRLDLKFTSHTKNKAMVFGFLGFKAEAIADLVKLDDAQLASNWAALIGTDPVAADAALWQLTATGNQAVSFVQSQMDAGSWTAAKDLLATDRVIHLLEVVNTPEAIKLAAKLKSLPTDAPEATTNAP